MLEHGPCHTRFVHSNHGQTGISRRSKELIDLVKMAGDMDRFIAMNLNVPPGDSLHFRMHCSHDRMALHPEDGAHLPEQLLGGCNVIDDET